MDGTANVVVSRHASQAAGVPILRSVTRTLRIVAGLLTPDSGNTGKFHHLIKINRPQSEAAVHDFDKDICFRLHGSANYVQSDWIFQNLCMYAGPRLARVPGSLPIISSSYHPVTPSKLVLGPSRLVLYITHTYMQR